MSFDALFHLVAFTQVSSKGYGSIVISWCPCDLNKISRLGSGNDMDMFKG
jgi:hypothetical protein